ncbi:MAG: MltA domain-containing protein [Elusimicrobia bacterium]|nr:MltA domain-containing protein [Elusimicrobiota bacterium]
MTILPLLSLSLAGALAAAPAPAASTGTAAAPAAAPAPALPPLRLLTPDELPAFADTFKSKAGLIKAAKKTLSYLGKSTGPKYVRIGGRDYGPAILADSIQELLSILDEAKTPEELDSLVRERFDVFQSAGSDGQGKVVFSSYYQPLLPAAVKKSAKYPIPIYRRPSDMVEVDLSAFGVKNGGDSLVGRVGKDRRVVPYFTREEIDVRKALRGKKLELAWLQNKWDVLDLHIQGSGILKYPSGKEMLARYAATNAQQYNSVGLTLVKAGALPREGLSYDKIRDYFKAHPEAEDWVISQNPRYTFFELVAMPPDGEPLGTVMESLAPARSIAVDPAVIPLGALAWFSTVSPQADQDGRLLGQFPNSRFALCMDTGGAIKGPGRVDIYAGHGKQATTTARNQWNEGKLYILVKKVPQRER